MGNLENQISIEEFLGTLLSQPKKAKKTSKQATSRITAQTRKESNLKAKKQPQREHILAIIQDNELTAREIAEAMHAKGMLPYPARAIIQPRITELVECGKLKAVRVKLDNITARKVAVYKAV